MDPSPIVISHDDLASPGQRLAAVAVDGLVFLVPMVVVFFLSWDLDIRTGDVVVTTWWPIAVLGVVTAVYEIAGIAVWGRTLGKLALHIRVCSATDLGRPGWLRALVRWAVQVGAGWVPVVGSLLSIAVVLPLVWTHKRQGLHDMAAGTLVVRDGV